MCYFRALKIQDFEADFSLSSEFGSLLASQVNFSLPKDNKPLNFVYHMT